MVSRAPSVACPWLPIWVITPAAFAALVSSRHSCERVRERLLAVDVLARADRGHRGDGVDVVGRADGDGVDVLGLLVEQLAEVLVAPGLGKGLEEPAARVVVDVAEGDDVRAVLGVGGDVAAAHAAGADPRDVDPLARRDDIPGPPGRVAARS